MLDSREQLGSNERRRRALVRRDGGNDGRMRREREGWRRNDEGEYLLSSTVRSRSEVRAVAMVREGRSRHVVPAMFGLSLF